MVAIHNLRLTTYVPSLPLRYKSSHAFCLSLINTPLCAIGHPAFPKPDPRIRPLVPFPLLPAHPPSSPGNLPTTHGSHTTMVSNTQPLEARHWVVRTYGDFNNLKLEKVTVPPPVRLTITPAILSIITPSTSSDRIWVSPMQCVRFPMYRARPKFASLSAPWE